MGYIASYSYMLQLKLESALTVPDFDVLNVPRIFLRLEKIEERKLIPLFCHRWADLTKAPSLYSSVRQTDGYGHV